MALDECAPCNCIPVNIPNDKFKRDVELLLCELIAATTGGGATPFAFQTLVNVPFGSITASYVSTGFFAGKTESNFLRITNNTDTTVDVRVGLAGGTIQLLSNSSQDFNNEIFTVDTLYLKYDSAPATLGSVQFEGAAR